MASLISSLYHEWMNCSVGSLISISIGINTLLWIYRFTCLPHFSEQTLSHSTLGIPGSLLHVVCSLQAIHVCFWIYTPSWYVSFPCMYDIQYPQSCTSWLRILLHLKYAIWTHLLSVRVSVSYFNWYIYTLNVRYHWIPHEHFLVHGFH